MAYSPISTTGSFIWRSFSTARTQPVTTTTPGNAWLVGAGATTTVTAISGGNATNWTRMMPDNSNTGGSPLVNFALWLGTINSVGTADIQFTVSGTSSQQVGAYIISLTCDGVSAATTWGYDVGGQKDNATNSTNVTFASLATAGPNRAYCGMTIVGSDVATTGQPAGWDIFRDPGPYFNAIGVNGTVGEGTITPVWKQTASDDSYNVGALVYAQNPDVGSFFPFFR